MDDTRAPVTSRNSSLSDAALEQLVEQAHNATASELNSIIHRALEHPNIYAFGELLDVPNIQLLKDSASLKLLELFAFGNYSDYKTNAQTFNTELNDAQLRKLKALTIIQMAQTNKQLFYDDLVATLDLSSVRQLEDLVIELIYNDWLRAKLDQSRRTVDVEYAVGRDVRREHLGELVRTLDAFRANYESVMRSLETQMAAANDKKRRAAATKERLDTELSAVHKTLRAVAAGAASQSHVESIVDVTSGAASSSSVGSLTAAAARHSKKKKPTAAQVPQSASP